MLVSYMLLQTYYYNIMTEVVCLQELIFHLSGFWSCSTDHITTIHNQCRPLHKTRFTTSKEQNAIGNLLGSSHATHRRDLYSRCQHLFVGLGHWCVYHAGADCVDSDEVLRVLDWRSVSMACCYEVYGVKIAYIDCVALRHVDYCCL